MHEEVPFADAPETIALWLTESQKAVAFSGAGISTESGIPDFRSPGGVWATSQPVFFDEFIRSAEARHEYWRQKAISHADFVDAAPNVAHQALARWEKAGQLYGVITQNIDGLHQIAGSRNVLELHGTAREVACLDCGWRHEASSLVDQFHQENTVPDCPNCGGMLKHATISFGQSLPADVLRKATTWARDADLFLALGSSLVVEPAASLPLIAKQHKARLIIINRDPTPLDSLADLVVRESLGNVIGSVDKLLEQRTE